MFEHDALGLGIRDLRLRLRQAALNTECIFEEFLQSQSDMGDRISRICGS